MKLGRWVYRGRDDRLRLEPVEALDAVREDWSKLVLGCESPFSSWEYASLWWKHFGAGRTLRVTLCRRATGEAFAILPLYEARKRPLRLLRFLGHGIGDQLGPICAAEDRTFTGRALTFLLRSSPWPWSLLLAERLPVAEGWGAALGGRPVQKESSPSITIAARDWEQYLSSRSRNLREQVRRRERKLAREQSMAYRLADDPSRLQDDFSTLLRLHRARWGVDSAAFAGGREAFHRDFAATAMERGWLRLWFLEIEGQAVAGWYGFRIGKADWFYQSGRDPVWDSYRVGFVLLTHTMRMAFADGMGAYHFLRGDEAYKGRFADQDCGLETLATGRGIRGRFGAAAVRSTSRLPPRLRRYAVTLAG